MDHTQCQRGPWSLCNNSTATKRTPNVVGVVKITLVQTSSFSLAMEAGNQRRSAELNADLQQPLDHKKSPLLRRPPGTGNYRTTGCCTAK